MSVGGQLRAEHVHRGIRHVLLGVVDEREPLADANRGRAVLPERLVETLLLHEGGQTAWMDDAKGVGSAAGKIYRFDRSGISGVGTGAGAAPGSVGSEGLGAPMYMDMASGLLCLPESRGAGVESSLPRPPRAHSCAPAPSLSR